MQLIPSTWTKCTNDELVQLYRKIIQEAKKQGKHFPKNFDQTLYMFNYMHTWGQERRNKQTDSAVVGVNKIFLKDPSKAVMTLCHEVAHVVSPPHENHGAKWLKNFKDIGEKFNVKSFNRCDGDDEIGLCMSETNKSRYKFGLYCPECKRIRTKYTKWCTGLRRGHWKCGEHKCTLIPVKFTNTDCTEWEEITRQEYEAHVYDPYRTYWKE